MKTRVRKKKNTKTNTILGSLADATRSLAIKLCILGFIFVVTIAVLVSIMIPPASATTTNSRIVGYSAQGRSITVLEVAPEQYSKTILLTAAMHGYEDEWDQDGLALVQIANYVFEYFSQHPEELHDIRLLVVPTVNPDGLLAGTSENGFGRCNAMNIDINRDFDYYFSVSSNSRDKTSEQPFATPEAQTLRNLILNEKPYTIIDLHGWLATTYGNEELAKYFNEEFKISTRPSINNMHNYFTGWASNYSKTLLMEYPSPCPQEWPKSMKQQYGMTRIDELNYPERTLNVLIKILLDDSNSNEV